MLFLHLYLTHLIDPISQHFVFTYLHCCYILYVFDAHICTYFLKFLFLTFIIIRQIVLLPKPKEIVVLLSKPKEVVVLLPKPKKVVVLLPNLKKLKLYCLNLKKL